MTINFYNNKAYNGHNGALSGRRGPGGGGTPPPPPGCVAEQGLNLTTNNASSATYQFPTYGLYDYGANLSLYPQSEIGSGEKRIVGMTYNFRYDYDPGYTYNDQTIVMAHIPATTLIIPDNTWRKDLSNVPGLTDKTTVKASFSWTGPTSSGWAPYITFDDYFCYNGTDNLLIAWYNEDGSYEFGYGGVYALDVGSYPNTRSGIIQQDNTPIPDTALFRNNTTGDDKVPNVRLKY